MKKTNLFVVDSPLQVLPFLKDRLKNDTKLLHFSSYCDLIMPQTEIHHSNRSSWVFQYMQEQLFNHCFWIHPRDSDNFPDRLTTDYYFGQSRDSSQYVTDVPEPFYYFQGTFRASNHIKNRQRYSLTVLPIHEQQTHCPTCQELNVSLLNQPFFLHIDISMFADVEMCQFAHLPAVDQLLRLYAPPPVPKLQLQVQDDAQFIQNALKLAQVVSDLRKGQLEQLKICLQDMLTGNDSASLNDPEFAQELFDLSEVVIYYLKLLQCVRRDDPSLASACYFAMLVRDNASKMLSKQTPTVPLSAFNQSIDTELMAAYASFLHQCFLDIANPYLLPFFEQRSAKKASKGPTLLPTRCDSTDSEEEAQLIMRASPEERKSMKKKRLCKQFIEQALNRLHNPEIIILSRECPEYSSSLAQLAKLAGTCPPCHGNTPVSPMQPYIYTSAQRSLFRMLRRVYGDKRLVVNLAYDGFVKC
ncbi:hypothetical protein Ciccas_013453 [Cichlidogyrus casuarinus]|uniref:Uncharacterized protein n=1 Tax=Cichlidogyrus casuarinus TaxID=1844966 RepID=A0ABD2PNL9_9PLAT